VTTVMVIKLNVFSDMDELNMYIKGENE